MLRLPNYNLDELSYGLEILRKDLTLISIFHDVNRIPILYDKSVCDTTCTSDDKHVEQSAPEKDEYNDYKILEALYSCNCYLNALSKERSSFHITAYPICNNGYIDFETEEDILPLEIEVKEYVELFKEKVWKSFAEINSFCKSLMSVCKFLAAHTVEADEVLYAFKHSIEVYERAISFDISCSDNAEKVVCALANVTSSTRSLHSYLWMIKTLMIYSQPNTSHFVDIFNILFSK